jgi:hypothetical protein
MRLALIFVVAIGCVSAPAAFAQKSPFTLLSDGTKSRVGILVSETDIEVTIRDLKEGIEVQVEKAEVKKIERGISDTAAMRVAGLAPIVAWRTNEAASRQNPVGKIAQITQNVVYITLASQHGLVAGQKLDVYRKKNEIVDPDTKKVLGVERPKVGSIEVTEINTDLRRN